MHHGELSISQCPLSWLIRAACALQLGVRLGQHRCRDMIAPQVPVVGLDTESIPNLPPQKGTLA
eukprot:5719822-Pyramimonas_sp.AAC.1